jgi:S-adenosyl-L-methionine hydrolase (adenosine-forming)
VRETIIRLSAQSLQFYLTRRNENAIVFRILPFGDQGLRLKIITLLTDFGLQDGYPGVMKGVIWGIAPEAQIADLTHFIHPQNVLEGALVLGRSAPYFPTGTIHTAVVDPGVGTQRRPIAAWLGNFYFVGPDNGLFTVLFERAQQQGDKIQIIHLDRPGYWLPEISRVFHGRDIFAPVAAHLANGIPLVELGTPMSNPQVLEIPRPQSTGEGWLGQVVMIDYFGNLATNLERQHLAGIGAVRVRIAGQEIRGLLNTFADAETGQLAAMYGEANDLMIAVNNGSAAQFLDVKVGEPVEVLPD